jgi:hypothetical protein
MPAISAANLVSGLLFGSIGFVGFIYGKRMNRWKAMLLGLGLMTYPCFVETPVAVIVIGVAGTVALLLFGR